MRVNVNDAVTSFVLQHLVGRKVVAAKYVRTAGNQRVYTLYFEDSTIFEVIFPIGAGDALVSFPLAEEASLVASAAKMQSHAEEIDVDVCHEASVEVK